MLTRRLLLALGVLSAFALTDCASQLTDLDGWSDYATHEPLPAVVVAASAAEVRSRCPVDATFVFGCAVRDTTNRVCVIFTDRKPLPGVLDHEFRHCAGYTHSARK